MTTREENPFETELVAKEWINSVENETGMYRDLLIYPMLEKWVGEVKPETLLEIGCGQGICSTKLGSYAGEYIGVEPSDFLLKRGQELYGGPKRKFLLGDAYSMPLEANSVDAAFSVNVWFHLEKLQEASKELGRVLKPGGQFMIITGNPSTYNVWEHFFFDYEKQGNKLVGKVNVPINHLSKNIFYLHSLGEIVGALKNSGLTVTSTEGFGGNEEYKDDGIFVCIKGQK